MGEVGGGGRGRERRLAARLGFCGEGRSSRVGSGRAAETQSVRATGDEACAAGLFKRRDGLLGLTCRRRDFGLW
jgi:hypothetical protein